MRKNNKKQNYLLKLGDKIAELRALKHISQETLSESLHCSPKTLSQVENGKVDPKLTFVISLADCLDVTLNELLPTKGDCNPYDSRQTN